MEYRIERDTLGEVKVPADKYWGAVTQRSLNNFPIGDERFRMPMEVIYAYAYIKKAAAYANNKLEVLDDERAELIMRVADEILEGKLDEHFPLKVWQTGSGTQTNMNVNEVIANRGHVIKGGKLTDKEKFLHPNDHVNRSQSSNDTFPTAMHIAAYIKTVEYFLPRVQFLYDTLKKKSDDYMKIVKIGRTHFMDAVPLTLGQELSGYVAQLEYGIEAVRSALDHVLELPLGGTAVGTGLNAPDGFDKLAISKIAEWTGYPFRPTRNKFAGLAGHEPLVNLHNAIKTLAVAFFKIANDIRILSSGPRCGIGEINLPANEPGSSIMPGKVNPTQSEMATMVAAQVMGNDVALTLGSKTGHMELNVFKPMIIYNVLTSLQLLADAMDSFARRAIIGMTPNDYRIKMHLEQSLMLVTALTPYIGYEKAAQIAKKAYAENKTLREVAIELGYLSPEEFDDIVRPEKMVNLNK